MHVRGAVVVVTGASSGIGRAVAEALARRGARLVLAARSEEALGDLASSLEARGVPAIAVATDVSDPEAVERLAGAAVGAFGRIDAWVNNAAVLAVGRLDEVPTEASRRVVEVNLLGYLYGARAAIARFRAQRRGVLVNVSSVLGSAAAPLVSSYVATKFAINGLAAALRQELKGDGDIHVCNVLPAAVETELYRHVANFTGREVVPPPPVYSPQEVAEAVVRRIERPTRKVTVGPAAKAFRLAYRLLPPLAERVVPRLVGVAFGAGRSAPTTGNLFRPSQLDGSGQERVGSGAPGSGA